MSLRHSEARLPLFTFMLFCCCCCCPEIATVARHGNFFFQSGMFSTLYSQGSSTAAASIHYRHTLPLHNIQTYLNKHEGRNKQHLVVPAEVEVSSAAPRLSAASNSVIRLDKEKDHEDKNSHPGQLPRPWQGSTNLIDNRLISFHQK